MVVIARPSLSTCRAHRRQPLVELAPEQVHLLGVRGQRLLPPGVGDRAQQRDERRRRREHDVALEGALHQRRVLAQRRVEERVRGHEADDELRRGRESLPVRLGRQRVDVFAQVPGVRLQAGGAGRLVARLHRLEVAAEGHLGVDDDVLAADEPDDQVRTHRAVGPRG